MDLECGIFNAPSDDLLSEPSDFPPETGSWQPKFFLAPLDAPQATGGFDAPSVAHQATVVNITMYSVKHFSCASLQIYYTCKRDY